VDDPSHFGSRAARAQCNADDDRLRAATQQRVGKRLTDRQIRAANAVGQDTRSFAEFADNLKNDRSLTGVDRSRNHSQERLDGLKATLKKTVDKRERAALKRRIRAAEPAAEAEAAGIESRKERAALTEAIAPALDWAERQLDAWRGQSDRVIQDQIGILANGMEAAKVSGDRAALETLIVQCQARVGLSREARAEGLKMQAAQLQRSASAINANMYGSLPAELALNGAATDDKRGVAKEDLGAQQNQTMDSVREALGGAI
jgi:hypothetical protein